MTDAERLALAVILDALRDVAHELGDNTEFGEDDLRKSASRLCWKIDAYLDDAYPTHTQRAS
jgi:hypothetical protein